jgi:hypothetical protein
MVNAKCLKHYIAGQKFIGKVEELNLQSPKAIIATKKIPY